mmetsp:Transcript_42093/g.127195  ORF Transcript_42093/g.127195 Transcript_42093/m.127195 type:complete len:207 (-) Transcript_42093:497-1117(-)
MAPACAGRAGVASGPPRMYRPSRRMASRRPTARGGATITRMAKVTIGVRPSAPGAGCRTCSRAAAAFAGTAGVANGQCSRTSRSPTTIRPTARGSATVTKRGKATTGAQPSAPGTGWRTSSRAAAANAGIAGVASGLCSPAIAPRPGRIVRLRDAAASPAPNATARTRITLLAGRCALRGTAGTVRPWASARRSTSSARGPARSAP